MKIAAVNIPEGYLPEVFGEDHSEVTINFGGINIYQFENGKLVNHRRNEFYLDDIFESSVSLLSCIVGANGGGESTLQRLIVNSYHYTYVLEDSAGGGRLAL